MSSQLVGTIADGGYTAEIYSTDLPGEFRIIYRDGSGSSVEETPLTGVSSYHQREGEIKKRMRDLREGSAGPPYLGDAGEY